MSNEELKYLTLLSKQYPNIQSASTEIINLEAILLMPKGTEHFVTDIHGEYETFNHILSNASGAVKRKIEDVFGKSIKQSEKNQLATLIYYPQEKIKILSKQGVIDEEWYNITLHRLVKVAREAARKYTRSKVRKAMPQEYAYIIDELLHDNRKNTSTYYDSILRSIIELKRADYFIEAISEFIKRMLIDRLHIIGDIYDRGPYAEKVMQEIVNYHSVDIQWGNHDIIWMGAACGVELNIAEVIRLSTRYANIDTIEDDYGINLMPLVSFALSHYAKDQATLFTPKNAIKEYQHDANVHLLSIIHKAISVICFKLEGQLIKRNPNFNMEHRLLLDKVDYANGTITINDKTYPLLDTAFPTIDPANPYELTKEEELVMEKLKFSFLNSEKLQEHVSFLFSKGSMYLIYNDNLMYHGCIPMYSESEFKEFNYKGRMIKGRELCDCFEQSIRNAWLRKDSSDFVEDADYFWYLWCGSASPIYGKDKMATFERYYIEDKETHKETQNLYYKLRNDEKTIEMILSEFGLGNNHNSRIINGHVPVKVKKGESPVMANGKLLVIDGGMSRPYQKETGIGGYTLVYSSTRLMIVAHEPFTTKVEAIEQETDIISQLHLVETQTSPILVKHTDNGKQIMTQIQDLKMLIASYNKGMIIEK